jgi:hypothetical protein
MSVLYQRLVKNAIRKVRVTNAACAAWFAVVIELSVAQRRFSMLVLAIFAAVAVILAVVGIYGVMSYADTAKTRDRAENRSPGRAAVRLGVSAVDLDLIWPSTSAPSLHVNTERGYLGLKIGAMLFALTEHYWL